MLPSNTSLLIFLTLFIYIQKVVCFLQSAYEISDLEETLMCTFQIEANNWFSSAPDTNSKKFDDCGGSIILGGEFWSLQTPPNGKYFQRNYSDIPAHNAVIFTFTLYVIDTWNPNEYIQIQFDSLPIFNGWTVIYPNLPVQICGGTPSQKDGIIEVYGYIPHIAPSLTLKFTSNFDQLSSNEAFGIRDLKLYFTQTNFSDKYICGIANGFILYDQETCKCPSNKYEDSSGNCVNCDDACLSCFGAGPDSCYKCKDDYYFDGTACTNCNNPCGNCGGPDPNHCKPCLSGYSLYNGTCILCPSGIIFEGLCIDTNRCTGLFTQVACANFCISPCDHEPKTTWNESCFPPCLGLDIPDLGLTCKDCQSLEVEYFERIEDGHLYKMTLLPLTCDLSLQTFLEYFNLTEVPDTVQPFQFEITKNDTSTYFIKIIFQELINQTEILNISLSHLNGTIIIPPEPIEIDEPEEQPIERDETDQDFEIPQISLGVIIGGSIIGTIALGASATIWGLVSFQQFIGYFIYINVHYPSQVEVFLSMLQISLWDILPNPLSIITEPLLGSFLENNKIGISKFQPPQKFMKYGETSFFIENGGSILVTNIILLISLKIILSLKSLERFQNRIFLKTVKVYLRWNVITRMFLENGLSLGLAIFLQLRILTFDGSYLIFCAILTIISIFYMIIMITFMMRVLYKRENDLLKKGLIKRIYGTLHEGLILKKSTSKYFHMVILFRGLLLVCLISFFEDSPLFQITPLIFFNIGLIYYMIKEVSFEDKKFDVITKIKEILILFGEIGIMLLVPKSENKIYFEVVGWCIVGVLGFGFFMELGYIIIIQIVGFKQIVNHFVQLWKSFYSYMRSFCSSKTIEKPKIIKTKARKNVILTTPQRVRVSFREFE